MPPTAAPAEPADDTRSTLYKVRNVLSSVARGAAYQVLQRADGWANVLTGAGRSFVDKVQAYVPTSFRRLGDNALSALYLGDASSRKACELRPKEALQRGVNITIPADKGGAEASTKMADELERLAATENVRLSAIWENLYGGAVIWLAVDDGSYDEFSQVRPLELERVRKLHYLRVLDRRQVYPDHSVLDEDPTSVTYGQPMLYLVDGGNGYLARVHRSRLILCTGATAPYEFREAWSGWGVSVLDIAWAALQRNGMVWGSSASAIANAQYVIYKIKDLSKMLMAADGEAQTKKRAQAMEMAKSMISAVLIDAEDDYVRENPDFGNLPEMIDRFMADLAHHLDMPITKLFGRSAAGMNATGDGEREDWLASLENEQEHKYRLRYHRICEVIFAAQEGPFKGVDPGGWKITFPALRQMTDKEKAEVRYITAQADALYITNTVITPIEVALSRFRPEGFSTETTIDLEMRERNAEVDADRVEAELRAAVATAEEREKNPLGVLPDDGPKPGGKDGKPDGQKPKKKKAAAP